MKTENEIIDRLKYIRSLMSSLESEMKSGNIYFADYTSKMDTYETKETILELILN